MKGSTMPKKHTETCYEYFNCKEFNCERRNLPLKQCWGIAHVLCHSHSEAFADIKKQFKSKLEACMLCMYYQEHH